LTTPSAQSYPENLIPTGQPKTKICSRKDCPFAGIPQPIEEFYIKKERGEQHRHSWCKTCCRAMGKIAPKKPRMGNVAEDGMKICSRRKCSHKREPQPISNFNKSKRTFDGLDATCKDCAKEIRELAKEANKKKFLSPSDVYIEGKTKTCSRADCEHGGVKQPVTNFYRKNSSTDGLCGYCKDCCDTLSTRYEENNKEKVKATWQAYVEKNRDKIKEYDRQYRANVVIPFRTEHWEQAKVKLLRTRARIRGILFDLEPSDLLPLPKYCPIFGILLDYSGGPDKRIRASVDRIKPELGYVKGNVRVISMAANMAKLDGDDDLIPIRVQSKKTTTMPDHQPSLFDNL